MKDKTRVNGKCRYFAIFCMISLLLCVFGGCGAKEVKETCSVDGCGKEVYLGGMCKEHFNQSSGNAPSTDGTDSGADSGKTDAGNGQKPSNTPTPEPTKDPVLEKYSAKFAAAKVGDIVTFGVFEQDADESDGKEEIEWIVLDKKDDKLLLFSKYILSAMMYYKEWDSVVWEESTLRRWLNNDFYWGSFDGTERNFIELSTLTNENNPFYGTRGGHDTKDKIFLLSLAEVKTYFSYDETEEDYWYFSGDERLIGYATEQAFEDGAYLFDLENEAAYVKDEGGTYFPELPSIWGLRTQGENNSSYLLVLPNGDIVLRGFSIIDPGGGVRPAVWVKINP